MSISVVRYVSLGDSLTAGYADGALHYEAQQNSYVQILAGQFKLMGGGDFRQPLLDPASVGINQYGASRLVLKKSDINPRTKELCYLAAQGDVATLQKNIYSEKGPFNNLGVPGAKMTSVVIPGYGSPENGPGNYNPFFARIAATPASSSILSDALAADPTFFSIFIGNNDALTYALSGGAEDSITPLTGGTGTGFQESLAFILDSLTRNGAKGVVTNIPDMISVPFFTAIPFNGLVLSTEKAATLSGSYPGILLVAGQNPFVVEDAAAQGGRRLMRKGELILVDILLDNDKRSYLGGEVPIPKKYYLRTDEIDHVQRAISGYNQALEAEAAARHLAFVDINSLLKKTKRDRLYNPQTMSLEFKKGVFSLDGLHPNPLGHAMLANQFIKAINQTYKMAIPFASMEPYKEMSFSQIERSL